MINTFQKILIASLLLISNSASACEYNSFDEWKNCFVQEKLGGDFSSPEADIIMQAEFTERAIVLDQKQPEKTLNYSQYLTLIGFNNKVKNAKKYYAENKKLLDNIAEEFDIEPEAIVALVGMESDFGKVQGKFNIVDTVASLSFDGRRKEFFEKELMHILKIAKDDKVKYEGFKGSWAGAMGQIQFMPSSFNTYAVDFDNDGVRDIWNSKKDVYASASNYLKKNGWEKGATFAGKDEKAHKKIANIAKCSKNNEKCGCEGQYCLISMKYDDIIPRTYVVAKNFDVLMTWNRSYYFCLSVMLIINELKKDANEKIT